MVVQVSQVDATLNPRSTRIDGLDSSEEPDTADQTCHQKTAGDKFSASFHTLPFFLPKYVLFLLKVGCSYSVLQFKRNFLLLAPPRFGASEPPRRSPFAKSYLTPAKSVFMVNRLGVIKLLWFSLREPS